MRKTKTKLCISIVTMLITVFMLLGTTYAWFTDSVSNTGNRIQAGTLDVDLLMYKGENGYVSIAGGQGDIFDEASIAQNSNETLWEPGKTQVVYLGVRNKGSLALKYNISINVEDYGLCNDGIGNSSLEYAIFNLGKDETIATQAVSYFNEAYDEWADIVAVANVADVKSGITIVANSGCLDEIAYDSSKTNETDYFALVVHMKEEAGNEYQDKYADIDVIISATQVTAEDDGFGNNDYDELYLISYDIDSSVLIDKKPLIISKTETITFNIQTSESINIVVSGADHEYESDELTINNPNKNVKITIKKEEGNCLAKGTMITMADNSLKAIEDIALGDSVLTFDHEIGEYIGNKVYFAYKGDYKKEAFTLNFTNNLELSIVGEHDLFEKESLKYVTIREENAEQFVGKHFYNATNNRYEELLSVTYESDPTEFYSIYTEYNQNCIANGMLTLPDDVDHFLNIYEFKEDLSADLDVLASDIEEYDFYEYKPECRYTLEEYNISRLKYINIVIGKGLKTLEELKNDMDDYYANYAQ